MYRTLIIQLCQGKYSFPFYGTFKVSRLMFGNSNLQLPPQIFYGIEVWRLARPLQGSIIHTSLTRLAGFDCWRFHLILDHLVLRSSSRTCCHSNRSVSLNLLGRRIRFHLFKQNWYLKYVPATATLLQEYPNNKKIYLKIILCSL